MGLVDLFREPECSGGKSTLVTLFCLFVQLLFSSEKSIDQPLRGRRELEDSVLSVGGISSLRETEYVKSDDKDEARDVVQNLREWTKKLTLGDQLGHCKSAFIP